MKRLAARVGDVAAVLSGLKRGDGAIGEEFGAERGGPATGSVDKPLKSTKVGE
jgi:hypothetical protein